MKKIAFVLTGILSIALMSYSADRSRPYVTFSGRFTSQITHEANGKNIYSQNGRFFAMSSCRDSSANPTAFIVYNNGKQIYSIDNVRGMPFFSNTGFCMTPIKDSTRRGLLAFNDPTGQRTLLKQYTKCELHGFSQGGSFFGIAGKNFFDIVDCKNGTTATYPPAYAFTVSDNASISSEQDSNSFVALVSKDASENAMIALYNGKKKTKSIALQSNYIRGIDISQDNSIIAIVDRNVLYVFALPDLKSVFTDTIPGNMAFMDVKLGADTVWTGIRKQNDSHTVFTGILRAYDFSGKMIEEIQQGAVESPIEKYHHAYSHEKYPWPFSPQDQPHTVWNGYLALSNSSDANSGAYLHQGLDIEVVANANCLAVENGFCKCVLTLTDESDPSIYWRTCVSPVNRSDTSDGFQFAHLNQSSITVEPGDTVKQGQLLATIIEWDALTQVEGTAMAHTHFSRVRDHGATWSYADDEWRNVCDPLDLIEPVGDSIKPRFLNASTSSKFFFSTNDSASKTTYLNADSLKGNVDIVVKMTDTVGTSKWEQPAHSIYYWVKNASTGNIVQNRKCGLYKNFLMPDYDGGQYSDTLPPIMYRIDSKCVLHSAWTTTGRYYYHTITNCSNDSTLKGMTKKEALRTANFGDGYYMIMVELIDCAGNSSIDSQKVYFRNGISGNINNFSCKQEQKASYGIERITINNSSARFTVNIPFTSQTDAGIYDIRGCLVACLASKCPIYAGKTDLTWNKRKSISGFYVFRINGEGFSWNKKFALTE